jgi:hypothetical protein
MNKLKCWIIFIPEPKFLEGLQNHQKYFCNQYFSPKYQSRRGSAEIANILKKKITDLIGYNQTA